ncbi:unnamed protein product, partial [Scytosiphon promiscuus]
AGLIQADQDYLTTFYDDLGGDNWANNANWSAADSIGWGVTVGMDENGTEHVVEIVLDDNNLVAGTIPDIGAGQLEHLKSLGLIRNSISGSLPAGLENLLAMQYFELSHNLLTGSIPPELGSLPLIRLYLSDNALSGEIPAELGNASTLSLLLLPRNDFGGHLPGALGKLSGLEKLDLSENTNLTGPIPPEFGDLVSLTHVYLDECGLTGDIPAELGVLAQAGKLVEVDLGDNFLTGAVPVGLEEVEELDLDGNFIEGYEQRDDDSAVTPYPTPTTWPAQASAPGEGTMECSFAVMSFFLFFSRLSPKVGTWVMCLFSWSLPTPFASVLFPCSCRARPLRADGPAEGHVYVSSPRAVLATALGSAMIVAGWCCWARRRAKEREASSGGSPAVGDRAEAKGGVVSSSLVTKFNRGGEVPAGSAASPPEQRRLSYLVGSHGDVPSTPAYDGYENSPEGLPPRLSLGDAATAAKTLSLADETLCRTIDPKKILGPFSPPKVSLDPHVGGDQAHSGSNREVSSSADPSGTDLIIPTLGRAAPGIAPQAFRPHLEERKEGCPETFAGFPPFPPGLRHTKSAAAGTTVGRRQQGAFIFRMTTEHRCRRRTFATKDSRAVRVSSTWLLLRARLICPYLRGLHAPRTSRTRRPRSSRKSDGNGSARVDSILEVARGASVAAQHSSIVGVPEVARLVETLVNLSDDHRTNQEAFEKIGNLCSNLTKVLGIVKELLSKDPHLGVGRTILEPVEEKVRTVVEVMKAYQGASRTKRMWQASFYRRRVDEAEAAVRLTLDYLNTTLQACSLRKMDDVSRSLAKMANSPSTRRKHHRQNLIQSEEIPEGSIEISDLMIGSGGASNVFMAHYAGDNVAAKVVTVRGDDPSETEHRRKSFLAEVRNMRRLNNSPRVVRVFGIITWRPGELVLVMKYMAGGDLFSFIKRYRDRGKEIDGKLTRNLIVDAAEGMKYLHQHKTWHGDLKSLNVLLDAHNQAYISDFGTSHWTEETKSKVLQSKTPGAGGMNHLTIQWAAPEV